MILCNNVLYKTAVFVYYMYSVKAVRVNYAKLCSCVIFLGEVKHSLCTLKPFLFNHKVEGPVSSITLHTTLDN